MENKKGEIATVLAISALFIMMAGILAGSSQKIRSLFSRAEQQSTTTENEDVIITWEPAPIPAKNNFVSYKNWILKGNLCFKKTPSTGKYSADAVSGATGKTEFGITVPFQAKCGGRGISIFIPIIQSACPVFIKISKVPGTSAGSNIEVPYFTNPLQNPLCSGFTSPTVRPVSPTPTVIKILSITPEMTLPFVSPTVSTSSCKFSASVKVSEYINTIISGDVHHKPKFVIDQFYAPDKWGFSNNKQSFDKPASRFSQNSEYKISTENLRFPYGGYTQADKKDGLGWKLFYDKDEFTLSDYAIDVCKNTGEGRKCLKLDRLNDQDDDLSTVEKLPIDCNTEVAVNWLLERNASCPFKAEARVYKDKKGGALVSQAEYGGAIWGLSNNKQSQDGPLSKFGQVASHSVNNKYAKFKPDDPIAPYRKGEKASVRLFLRDWEIIERFCDGEGCPKEDINKGPLPDTISNFVMGCNTNINYGWVVKRRVDRTYQLNLAKKDRPAQSPDNICSSSAANSLDKTFSSSGDYLGKNEDYGCSGQVKKTGKDIKELSTSYVNRGENDIVVAWTANICDGTFKDNQTGNPKCDKYRGGGSPTWTLRKNQILKCSWKNPYPSIPNLNGITDNCIVEEAPEYLSKPKGIEPAAYSLMVYKNNNSLQNCFAASRNDGGAKNIVGNVEFSNYGSHDCRARVEGSHKDIQYIVEYTNNESTPQTITWQTNACNEAQIQHKDGKVVCSNLIGGGKGQSSGSSGNPFNSLRNLLFGSRDNNVPKSSPQATSNSAETLNPGQTRKCVWTYPAGTWDEPRCDGKVCHARPTCIVSNTPTQRPVCSDDPPQGPTPQPPNPEGKCLAGTCPQEGKCWSPEIYETGQDCPGNQSKKVERSIEKGQCKYTELRSCTSECERPKSDGGRGGICEGSPAMCNGRNMQNAGHLGCENNRFCCVQRAMKMMSIGSSPQSCQDPVSICRSEGGLCRDRSEGCPNAYPQLTTTGCGQSDIPLICCKSGKKLEPTPSPNEANYIQLQLNVSVPVKSINIDLVENHMEIKHIDIDDPILGKSIHKKFPALDSSKIYTVYVTAYDAYRQYKTITQTIKKCSPNEGTDNESYCSTKPGGTIIFDIEPKKKIVRKLPKLSPNISPKVLIISYDPVMVKPDGTALPLSSYLGWNNPFNLADELVNWFREKTNEKISYEIVDRIELDEYPAKEDGFIYTDYGYHVECFPTIGKCALDPPVGCKCHQPSGTDYRAIEERFDICGKANRGEIDEVWLFGAPEFGFSESKLIGKNTYRYISGPIEINKCNKPVPVMGFNYERDLSEMVHDYGHRTEAAMTKVYGGWNTDIYSVSHTNWDKFARTWYDFSGCGKTHYPPNSSIETGEYRYDKSESIKSYCDAFFDYPELKNLNDSSGAEQKTINCNAWDCTQSGFIGWWLGHLPRTEGVGPDGKLNDWWQYIMFPDLANY